MCTPPCTDTQPNTLTPWCPPWLQYHPGSPGYKALCHHLVEWEHQPASPAGRLFYLALPPYVYPEVSQASG
jgi:hypothetical protein